jgi:hypothetical protein
VKDTGQSAKLQAQLLEIQAAEITGAVIRYNAAAASASAVEATAAPRVCKSVKAATEMFRAYAQLKARGKAGLVDKKKLDNCLRFQVKFNTLLDWRVPGSSNTHQDVELSILLPFRELAGSFWSVERTKVNEERVTQPECNVLFKLEKIGSPTVSDMMVELLVPAFSRSDDLLSDLGLRLYYEIDPTANQDWRITCTQQIPPAPPIGPITSEFHTSWSGNYTSFHLSEIEEHGFRAKLVKSASPSVYAERVYNQGSELLYFEEHTLFSVFFKPK